MNKSLLFALLVASFGLAGCPPKPFVPDDNCSSLPNCGQCASRGGCSWCGDRCLAVDKNECPSGWIKTPDACPPPQPPPAASTPQ